MVQNGIKTRKELLEKMHDNALEALLNLEVDLAIKERVNLLRPNPQLQDAISQTKVSIEAQNMGIAIIQDMLTEENTRTQPWTPAATPAPKITVLR